MSFSTISTVADREEQGDGEFIWATSCFSGEEEESHGDPY